MGWSIGFDPNWNRDVGYGVPALCDHPVCTVQIDRGLAYICGQDVYGGEHGCGLAFCYEHLEFGDHTFVCERCAAGEEPFEPKPDVEEWMRHKLADESWAEWRVLNPVSVIEMVLALSEPLG